MAIDGTSTVDELLVAYGDNIGYYHGGGSVSQAREFAKACGILLGFMAAESERGSGATRSRVKMNPDAIQRQLDQANAWLRKHDSAVTKQRVTQADVSDFRG